MILVGAVGVVTSRNPVHAALSLVMTLFGVAVLFIEQQADFLAAVQIIVYAGAIVVLFLFVIMFLGVDRPRTSTIAAHRSALPSFLPSPAASRHAATRTGHRAQQVVPHSAFPPARRGSRPAGKSSH